MSQKLDCHRLTDLAMESTGLHDFGDVPFAEALKVLVDSLEREAKLDDARRAQTERLLVGLLGKGLKIAEDRKQYPDIASQVVKSPIFIVGLPRTGSTHLHALLAQCEGIRAPLLWEMALPSPPPRREEYQTDPRIAEVNKAFVANIPDEILKRHPVGAQRPEQCNMLNDFSFMDWGLSASYEIPGYRDWMLATDHGPAYLAHKRMLQHLQSRHPGQWVLKYPKHVFTLDVLLETYPDAKLIWTHRDPGTVIPSVASLTGALRSPTPGYDPVLHGRAWAMFEELGLKRGLAMRDALFKPEQICDIHYRDMMRDPVATIEGAFAQFGLTLSDNSRRNILQFVADNPQTKHGVHTYSAEQFGLDADRLRKTYRPYIERFNVIETAKRPWAR